MSILAKSGFQNQEWRENEAFIDLGVVGEAKRVVLFDENGVSIGTLGTAIVAGQLVIAVTGTRIQLPSVALKNGVILSSKTGNNSAGMTIGGSGVTNTVDGSGNGVILAAGASISAAVDNTNRLYANGTSGDILSWIGT